MLDLNFIPGVGEIGNATHDIFYGQMVTATFPGPIPWFKPRGKRMCRIFALGGGGAGGAGGVGAAGAAGGGGGGGSGAQTSLTLPLWALPDVLMIYPGLGGTGVGTGGVGQSSYVSFQSTNIVPVVANTLVLARAGTSQGVSGGTTGNAAGGTGGAVTAIGTAPRSMLHGVMATNVNLAGQAGAIGGIAQLAGAGSATAYPITGLIVLGGAGGGAIGTTANGGAGGEVNASTVLNTPAVAGGIASAGAGGNGNAGFRWPYLNDGMMVNSGGSGGAGSAFNSATSGGNGGDGGYGCGGGGGGACLTGGVGGRGGNGGPGLVIITCW